MRDIEWENKNYTPKTSEKFVTLRIEEESMCNNQKEKTPQKQKELSEDSVDE